MLNSLLDHQLLPEEKTQAVTDYLHWNVHDTYLCMLLALKSHDDLLATLDPLAIELSKTFRCDCYIVRDGCIVFFFNLTQMKTNTQDLIHRILPTLPTLRDNLLYACTSNPFQNFGDLFVPYPEALLARQLGGRRDSTRWHLSFSDYHLDYIIRNCREHAIPQILIPAGIRRLQTYDARKGTAYTSLLKIYLQNERNIAITIREAGIPRNTFLYRIKRIEELLDMDLADPDVRLTLLVAYAVQESDPPPAESVH